MFNAKVTLSFHSQMPMGWRIGLEGAEVRYSSINPWSNAISFSLCQFQTYWLLDIFFFLGVFYSIVATFPYKKAGNSS